MQNLIEKAAAALLNSSIAVVFTGAGISVESGIPPFRGEGGLWNKYDPSFVEINYFYKHPLESWKLIREVFYDFFGQAEPNAAHLALAELEKKGIVKAVITQNIDNLHQAAGSKVVWEFHGSSEKLACTDCASVFHKNEVDLHKPIPSCKYCGSMLKPDFIFFGEGIPEPAGSKSFDLGEKTDCLLVIGTTGEVMPACQIPYYAKRKGATIIEINPSPSNFTHSITDIYLQGKATEVMEKLLAEVIKIKSIE